MLHNSISLNVPKLRPGIDIKINKDQIEINYKSQGCVIDVPGKYNQELLSFFKQLQNDGIPLSMVDITHPKIKEEIIEIINELDKFGLLTESDFKFVKQEMINGQQLYNEMLKFSELYKQSHGNSVFYSHLVNKTISYNQLLGYALEYYHVVKLAPGILGSALSNIDNRSSQKILQNFIISEMHHDKMLERSLKAVNITSDHLTFLQPLPMTFAICSTLGILAKQHPLSFKAALFLFEQPYPDFNAAFVERCKAFNLPEGFYEPIIKHSDINEEGEHDDISRILLAQIDCISKEEMLETKKNILSILEFMTAQDLDIIGYYGDNSNLVPRIWYR